MTEYDNTNRGAIWGNKRKETETHPDFTGSINVEGIDYWLNGWKRKPEASENSPSMSFSVRKKEEQQSTEIKDVVVNTENDLDDNIPF
tara:strand:- start:164 stop:427 length:264 start_codon:yes stop_codon:yes gene_type:complete